jgi:ribosomal protein RSM22 (predicted rRNA methylase)
LWLAFFFISVHPRSSAAHFFVPGVASGEILLMQLPATLRAAIEALTADAASLSRAAAELSDAYRAGRPGITSAAHRLAYLHIRLPATYAACHRVFAELRARTPDLHPRSLLDLGAGPGTAAWAALAIFPNIERITLVERDPEFISLGRKLADSGPPALRSASWLHADMSSAPALDPHDVVVGSYALGELTAAAATGTVRHAWALTSSALLLIEPGTPRGFATILAARDGLTSAGAHIAAPCPVAPAHTCPMAAMTSWCHFAARVERTSLHRRLKSGELPYEDEKFSYAILTRTPANPASARIVRHPVQHKGHIELELCTPAAIERRTVSKRDRDAYRAARKAEWGDEWSDL